MRGEKWRLASIVAMVLLGTSVAPSKAADLEVSISKLRSTAGSLIVCLFNEPDEFPRACETQPFRRVELPAGTQPPTTTFRDLPDGAYAVVVLHNETGKLERNILGVPKFGIGLKAGGWPPVLGPPSFAKNKLDLRGRVQVAVEMRYF